MITRNDLVLLLTDLENKGTDITPQLNAIVNSNTVPLEVLKFINTNRQLDLSSFYLNIRKNYNNKRSKLYGSIVKEESDTDKVLVTLSALLTQILLYKDKATDKTMFLKHARADEISRVLHNYFKTYDISSCLKLLRLIKIDCKVMESLQ